MKKKKTPCNVVVHPRTPLLPFFHIKCPPLLTVLEESPAQDVEPALSGVLEGSVEGSLTAGLAGWVVVLGEEAIHGRGLGLELGADVHGDGGDCGEIVSDLCGSRKNG